MPRNKNALLRYRTIDRCLRNTGRRWTLQDLVDACSDALYEYEGKQDLVSTRTVQLDIQMMRSDRLGYEAPIEVYDKNTIVTPTRNTQSATAPCLNTTSTCSTAQSPFCASLTNSTVFTTWQMW